MEHLTDFSSLINETLVFLDAEGYDKDKYNKRMINDILKSSYIEFVKDSECIISTAEIVTQKDVHEYPFFNYNGYNIKKIKSLSLDGCCMKVRRSPCSCKCCPRTYSYNDGWIHICQAPNCDGKIIEICGVFFPEKASCKPEKRIIELHGDAIIKGALSKLLGFSRTQYTYHQHYERAKDNAAYEAAKSYSTMHISQQKPPWVNF